MIKPAQCRAARGLLNWSQQELAERAGIGNATIRNFESGKSALQRSTMDVLHRAFEASGVEFISENGGGAGVRLSKAGHKDEAVSIPVEDLSSQNDE